MRFMKKNIFWALIFLSLIFIICLYLRPVKTQDAIYFIPGYHKNLFGDDGKGFFGLANAIKEKGYKAIETTSYKNLKNAKYIVIFDIHKKKLGKLKRLPSKKLILFAWEPPVVIPLNHDKKYHKLFSKIYTFNDDLIDNKKCFKFYYPDARPMIKNSPDFSEKKLICLVSSDKSSNHKNEMYTERRNAIKYFENVAENDFDLYGVGWKKNEFKSYKGAIGDKIAILKNYKFSICYENTKNINGYITEKIFDAFQAGCVPVYLGAENITDYIPKNCFIDKRDFKNYNDLHLFLKSMTKEQYSEYLKNINAFLNSEEAYLFTGKNLIETFLNALDLKDIKP